MIDFVSYTAAWTRVAFSANKTDVIGAVNAIAGTLITVGWVFDQKVASVGSVFYAFGVPFEPPHYVPTGSAGGILLTIFPDNSSPGTTYAWWNGVAPPPAADVVFFWGHSSAETLANLASAVSGGSPVYGTAIDGFTITFTAKIPGPEGNLIHFLGGISGGMSQGGWMLHSALGSSIIYLLVVAGGDNTGGNVLTRFTLNGNIFYFNFALRGFYQLIASGNQFGVFCYLADDNPQAGDPYGNNSSLFVCAPAPDPDHSGGITYAAFLGPLRRRGNAPLKDIGSYYNVLNSVALTQGGGARASVLALQGLIRSALTQTSGKTILEPARVMMWDTSVSQFRIVGTLWNTFLESKFFTQGDEIELDGNKWLSVMGDAGDEDPGEQPVQVTLWWLEE